MFFAGRDGLTLYVSKFKKTIFSFQVLKAASPVLLRIILLGAFLLYCPVSIWFLIRL